MEAEIPKELVTPGERNFFFPVEGHPEEGQAYFCAAGRESKHAIVFIQEWWGLNVAICKQAETFAA